MSASITTKYLPATNTKGSRVKATSKAGSITMSYDHELDTEANHAAVAKKLAVKLMWKGYWYVGALPDGRGNIYAVADTSSRAFTVA